MAVSDHRHASPAAHTRGTRGRDWDERKNAHASVVTVHREILFAPTHPNRPIFDDREHAWAVFVSVKRHATNESTTLGRYFFHQNPYRRPQAATARLDQESRRGARPYISDQAPLVWRAPGGPEGPGCGARGRWRGLAGLRDDAPSRRLAARTTRGRAAAHGHTKQPGPTEQDARRPEHQRHHTETTRGVDGNQTQHSTGARARRPAPLDATTQTLRSTCVPFRSAHAAHRSRRSSRSPRLRRRAGPRR